MKKLFLGLFILGLTIQGYAQVETVDLTEVEVLGVNYKYLSEVGTSESEVAKPVKILQRKAANFDLKSAEFYVDEEMDYDVYFKIPQGKILAIYNGEGEIIRTSERFKDIALPLEVVNTVLNEYPGWIIGSDLYLVTYRRGKGAEKTYKLLLEKGKERKWVKTDDKGKFI